MYRRDSDIRIWDSSLKDVGIKKEIILAPHTSKLKPVVQIGSLLLAFMLQNTIVIGHYVTISRGTAKCLLTTHSLS